MGSGIGNRAIMRALGKVLGIEDVRQAPQFLRTDELIPTIALDPGAAGVAQVQLIGQVSVAGLAGWTWQLIGSPDTLSTPGLPPQAFFANNADVETVILGMRVQLAFTAAGRDAAVGTIHDMRHFRQAATSTVSVVRDSSFPSWAIIDPIRRGYDWSFPMWQRDIWLGSDPPNLAVPSAIMAASPIYVPAGSKFGLESFSYLADMSNFSAYPAGTVLNVEAFLVTSPKGMRPQGI
jgi:hypothetical protein